MNPNTVTEYRDLPLAVLTGSATNPRPLYPTVVRCSCRLPNRRAARAKIMLKAHRVAHAWTPRGPVAILIKGPL